MHKRKIIKKLDHMFAEFLVKKEFTSPTIIFALLFFYASTGFFHYLWLVLMMFCYLIGDMNNPPKLLQEKSVWVEKPGTYLVFDTSAAGEASMVAKVKVNSKTKEVRLYEV